VGDPLYHDNAGRERLRTDPGVRPMLMRVQLLKLASALIALTIIAAVWIVWRWS